MHWRVKVWIQTDQDDFIDEMAYLPRNFKGKISSGEEALLQIPEVFDQHRIAEKAKNYLGVSALI